MRLAGRPTLQTLVVLVAVHLVQAVTALLGPLHDALFVLDAAFVVQPWTLVTHVYAHAHPGHLLANAVALAIVGPLVARRTTTLRFHLYFLGVGVVAGLAQVVVAGALGPAAGVLGASGAVFALFGYLLTGNVVAAGLLSRLSLSPRVQLVLFAAVVVVVTLATAGPRVALVSHAVGLAVGLVAGRARLLDTAGARASRVARPDRSR